MTLNYLKGGDSRGQVLVPLVLCLLVDWPLFHMKIRSKERSKQKIPITFNERKQEITGNKMADSKKPETTISTNQKRDRGSNSAHGDDSGYLLGSRCVLCSQQAVQERGVASSCSCCCGKGGKHQKSRQKSGDPRERAHDKLSGVCEDVLGC